MYGTLPPAATATVTCTTSWCRIQTTFPRPGRERPALGRGQGLGLPAHGEVDDDDDELFHHSHDDPDGDGAVDEAEVVVVQEDGEQGVDDADGDEREGEDDGEGEVSLARVRAGESRDGEDGRRGEGGEGGDVEEHAGFGRRLHGEGARGRDAAGAADDAEDQAERDDELGAAELDHVQGVGGVEVDGVHAAWYGVSSMKARREEKERGGGLSTYQRESRPRVARSRGEMPTESRMKVASKRPDDWDW